MTARRLLAGALVLGALAGCRREPVTLPEVAPALALFELAGVEDPDRDALARVVDDALLGHDNPELLDALDRLRADSPPEVLRVEPLPGLDRVAVDLRAGLAGDADAGYSVQTARRDDGSWRVVWFRGPGVNWPAQPAPRGSGLTGSAPPDPG